MKTFEECWEERVIEPSTIEKWKDKFLLSIVIPFSKDAIYATLDNEVMTPQEEEIWKHIFKVLFIREENLHNAIGEYEELVENGFIIFSFEKNGDKIIEKIKITDTSGNTSRTMADTNRTERELKQDLIKKYANS